jgi:hypothetical protein
LPAARVSAAAGLLLLLAFALRVYQLGAQSLWADEGYGLYLASEPLRDLSRDILIDLNHVPLYFLGLHFWVRLAGDSELAVRYLSLTGGVLVVALTYRLGRKLAGPVVGLVAAALSTVAPFQVYYSQEARMHIWTTAFGLLAANALVWALESPRRWRRWALYALAGILGLYTFYYAGFVLAANAAILIAFAPWAALVAARLYQQAEHKSKDFVAYDFGTFLAINGRTFTGGVTFDADRLAWPLWPVALALLLGAIAVARRRYGPLVLAYLLAPLLGVFFLNLRFPHFVPRYLLLATPPFYLLIAAGLVWPLASPRRLARLAAPAAALALAALGATQLVALANNYFDPAYARDDYRGVARAISRGSQPDDVVILDAFWQRYNFPYYYRGPLPVVDLPHEDPLDPAVTTPQLEALAAAHAGVWLVLYGDASMDPTGYVQRWFEAHSYKVEETWYGTVRLVHFLNPIGPSPPPEAILRARPLDYAGGLSLVGYELAGDPPEAGAPAAVRLLWRTREPPRAAYSVSLRLFDGEGRLWAQADGKPLQDALPTDRWPAGTLYRDPYLLPLPPGLPPGPYALRIVVYSERGEAAPAEDTPGTTIEVRPVRRLPEPDPPLARPASGDLGPAIQLLGADLPAGPFPPGARLDLRLMLRGRGPGAARLRVVALRDGQVAAAGAWSETPPLRPGELRQLPQTLTLPPRLADGAYALQVEGEQGRASLGTLSVKDRPRRFEPPAGVARLDAPAGGGLELAGATIPPDLAPELNVRLVWRAAGAPDADFVAFLHLVDAADRIVAQSDGPPAGLPTSTWRAGEVVLDDRRLAVPPVPAGRYRLYTGLYRPQDGVRIGPGDGRIPVGEVVAR